MANRWNRWSSSGRVGGGADRWTHSQGDYRPEKPFSYYQHAGKALAAGAAALGLRAAGRVGYDAYNNYMRGGRSSSSSRSNKRRASNAYSRKAYDRWAYSDPPAGSGRIPRAALKYASSTPNVVVSGVAGKYFASPSRFGGASPVGKFVDLSTGLLFNQNLANPDTTNSSFTGVFSLCEVPTLTDPSTPGIQSSRATGSMMVDEIHLDLNFETGRIGSILGSAWSTMNTGFFNYTMEIFVVLDLQCNAGLPSVSDMLAAGAAQSSYVGAYENLENGFRFRTLFRKKFTSEHHVAFVTTSGNFVVPEEEFCQNIALTDLSIPIEFSDDSTSGAVNTMKSANIVIFGVSTLTDGERGYYTSAPRFGVRKRLLFHDLH